MTELSETAKNFNWLIDDFVNSTAGVTDAIAVSSDGLENFDVAVAQTGEVHDVFQHVCKT